MEVDKLGTVAGIALKMSREDFVQAHPHPFLLGLGPSGSGPPPGRRAFQTMAGFQVSDSLASGVEKELPVHMVRKSERNSFHNMITLGRIDNNDIILDHPSVSKFHAYFTPGTKNAPYSLCDAESRFGTFVDERKLRPATPKVLQAGATLVFGKGPRYSYFPPEDFFDYIKVLQGLGKL